MTHHLHLTPISTVDRAAVMLTESIRWMRTDQAAVMRQLPEQQTAATWWAATHEDRADVIDTLPAWLLHYYDITVDPHSPTGNLSRPAAMVQQLLTARAATLTSMPLLLVSDPQVRTALVTLANTPIYQQLRGWVAGSLPAATILFSDPISFRHRVTATGADPLPERDSDPRNAELHGVTWFHDTRLRCMDWVNVVVDTTGVRDIDEKIATHARHRAHHGLPSMLNNGEWFLTGDPVSVDDARSRLQRATAFVRDTRQRWDGTPIVDTGVVLAPALAAAAADAIATNMMSTTARRVRTRAVKPAAAHRHVSIMQAV